MNPECTLERPHGNHRSLSSAVNTPEGVGSRRALSESQRPESAGEGNRQMQRRKIVTNKCIDVHLNVNCPNTPLTTQKLSETVKKNRTRPLVARQKPAFDQTRPTVLGCREPDRAHATPKLDRPTSCRPSRPQDRTPSGTDGAPHNEDKGVGSPRTQQP